MTPDAARLAFFVGILAIAALLDLASGGAAHAGSPADFYRGKTITIVAGSPTGGGQNGYARALGRLAGSSLGDEDDAYERTLARYLGSHIPGSPRVIVRDLSGEEGLASVQYLEETAPKDGTFLATLDPSALTEAIIGASSARANFSELSWIGGVSPDFRICYAWAATGVKTWNDLAKGRDLAFGATGEASLSYIDVRMLRSLFKRKVRPVLGYPGRTDIYFAIARGELDGACGPIAGLPTNWLRENRINVLVRLVKEAVPGIPQAAPDVGQLAQSDEQRRVAELVTGASELGKSLIIAKQAPTERLKSLRQAFDATMRDPNFLAACARQNLSVAPMTGQAAQRMAESLYDAPFELVQKAREVLE